MTLNQAQSLSWKTFAKLFLVLFLVTGCASYHSPVEDRRDIEEGRAFR